MEFFVRFLAQLFRVVFHNLPKALLRWIAHADKICSVLNLYTFMQALSLFMFLFTSVLAALSAQVSTTLVDTSREGAEADDTTYTLAFGLWWPFRWAVKGAVYACALQGLFFLGRCLWTIAWEIYYDFPTIRRMLRGPAVKSPMSSLPTADAIDAARKLAAACSDSEDSVDSSEDGPHKPWTHVLRSRSGSCATDPAALRRERRRRIVLTAPMVILTWLYVLFVLGTRFCDRNMAFCSVGTGMLIRNTRMHRVTLFSLFVSQMQMLVVWTSFFPKWHRVFLGAQCNRCVLTAILSVTLQVVLAPSLVTQGVLWLAGLPPNPLLMATWSVWFLAASVVIMRTEHSYQAGFRFRTVTDEETWKSFSTLFKFTGILWGFIYLSREVANAGFHEMLKDHIACCLVYPLQWSIVWVLTYIAVVSSRCGREFWLALLGTSVGSAVSAWALCYLVGRNKLPLLVFFVWVCLFRYSYLWLKVIGFEGRESRVKTETLQPVMKFAVDPSGSVHERKVASETARMIWAAVGAFCLLLACCSVLATAQQRSGNMTDGGQVRWFNGRNGLEIHKSDGSSLTLGRFNDAMAGEISPDMHHPEYANLRPGATPRYGVCGYKWNGLAMKDFAIFSMLSYMSPLPENDLQGLIGQMMPGHNATIIGARSVPRKWLEFEVDSCPQGSSRRSGGSCRKVSVVAISGTDPSSVEDILENIRMWTEPAMMEIFSVLFPVVRFWPRETTAMLIGGIHRVIRWLGVQDDRWHYQEILDHVRRIPDDREVVLTGHSLGGGMALVVGALSGRHVVAVQPPGLYHSLAKHQEQDKLKNKRHGWGHQLHQSSVSLVVENDWISNFDGHGGLVQTITCDGPNADKTMGCHLLEGTLCSLMRHCGDEDEHFATCRQDLQPAEETEEVAGNGATETDSFRELTHSYNISFLAISLAGFVVVVLTALKADSARTLLSLTSARKAVSAPFIEPADVDISITKCGGNASMPNLLIRNQYAFMNKLVLEKPERGRETHHTRVTSTQLDSAVPCVEERRTCARAVEEVESNAVDRNKFVEASKLVRCSTWSNLRYAPALESVAVLVHSSTCPVH